MTENQAVISTINLTRTYSDGQVKALDNVNLRIMPGEFVAIMGPSGSGKSTLLNMIGALDQPTSGEVWVRGQNLATVKNLDQFRAGTVGFIFQLHNLLPALTARENVEVPMHGRPIGEKERKERAIHLLEQVGLNDRNRHLPGQLSGGQRQRVAVARALANDPTLLLADEPTGSLDTQSGNEIMALLEEINQKHRRTIIVVTHDIKVARRAARILTMVDGQIADDHRVRGPLVEDLRELAHSELGHLLLQEKTPDTLKALAEIGLVRDGRLSETARDLQKLMERFNRAKIFLKKDAN